ncbi:MAG: TrbC/VirB2 family protein [Alphaproteobacteria bacterium]|nr:TrbC/VirB2 family protein [Alphaproteobacteria bacterium]
MNKFLKYLSFFAIVALAFVATDAFATNTSSNANDTTQVLGSSNDVFKTVLDRMVRTFQNVRSVIFVVGGFGLVGLAFAAIFGKVKWSWLAALAVGLAIVALAGAVVDYVTRGQTNQTLGYVPSFQDTLDRAQ